MQTLNEAMHSLIERTGNQSSNQVLYRWGGLETIASIYGITIGDAWNLHNAKLKQNYADKIEKEKAEKHARREANQKRRLEESLKSQF